MCVLTFAWKVHPRWRLVVAANRDESHARPAKPVSRWDSPNHLLAGTDLQSGGTWLGVSERVRFAAVTNLRGYSRPVPGSPSRGVLVRDFLSGEGEYARADRADNPAFGPFNLLVIDQDEARLLTNRPKFVRREVKSGIYGLSNGGLDEVWPKTAQLRDAVREWIGRGETAPEPLLEQLQEDALPTAAFSSARHANIPPDAALSPIFIRNDVYGTRCSTVVTVDRGGLGHLVERRFSPGGEIVGETRLQFSWPL